MKKNGTKILIGIALALILVACGVLAVYFFAGRNNSDDVISLGTDIVGEKKEGKSNKTNGNVLIKTFSGTDRPIAVMIDNHKGALPQGRIK